MASARAWGGADVCGLSCRRSRALPHTSSEALLFFLPLLNNYPYYITQNQHEKQKKPQTFFFPSFFLVRLFFFSSSNRSKTLYINGKSHNIPIRCHPSGEREGQTEQQQHFPAHFMNKFNSTQWMKSYSHLKLLKPRSPRELDSSYAAILRHGQPTERLPGCRQFDKVKLFIQKFMRRSVWRGRLQMAG